ncbi:MAG: YciI family protein [Candidatus Promineifilaceae bacterium]
MTEVESMYENDDSLVPKEMTTYFHGLLRRGAKWTPEETEETERVQEAHLAHIRRMFEEGDLVIAGPFTDGGDLRGVFVFRTRTLEEAQALAAADPAVRSGRLVVEIHPWMVPSGVLPQGNPKLA